MQISMDSMEKELGTLPTALSGLATMKHKQQMKVKEAPVP